ncbi:MAG: acyl-CoA dehydrogenase C-terminal domain-containing protein [Candidatus Poseidoniia archaeon]|mgnify:CR=1 FL=1|jgi:butyryl-CoA dehydrogenase|nr:acyl-CoA dehydrogenase C-terminal domain-containing protein [Candidatus Poseidoniia archaeon]MDP6658137.1 acyl-CoA dehydrogenase C-terminal domain-containing protein [Candidatus Poseidoniia archaeon]MDP6846494.1 acyl-CoA dehydrogenase C-terminal domain-containing protein [Candidatus Poseidoniia archaeon]MDP7007121.1 acyl-CoA dehydrogenase C-terminal domain-containing protein [Candidatus Poseidoniia archaeon]|tara:strand:- start:12 stop:1814 length:1803 start_codon:yes stop_codon:yes gene_type:complete
MKYRVPKREFEFVLREVMQVERLTQYPGYEEVTWDMLQMITDQVAEIVEDVWLPSNKIGDQVGAKFKDGEVTLPPEFHDAINAIRDTGLVTLFAHQEYGGMGFPTALEVLGDEVMCATNMALATISGLTKGAYRCIHQYGSEELKTLYLPRMVSGEWFGTMCLTEAHCGTDLGLLRTRAVEQENGSYRLSGEKIFITGGEHDLTENILHLVLARLPDAPKGVKGISLFLVPKFIPADDGSLGERNSIRALSIEEKMGCKGSPTCVIALEEAQGWLIGEENRGLRAMFSMMNHERLAVGMEGIGIGEIAYQNGLAYALDRLQGRDLKGARFPEQEADPLIVHPDIRRMLLRAKSLIEGMRCLAVWTGMSIDRSHADPDEATREANGELVEILTPIVKALCTDLGCEIANDMLQIYGGHGYIKEHGMEQLVRDLRIAPIWEGANGIQALDLAGRKLPRDMGRLLRRFFHPALEFVETNRDDPDLKEFVEPFAKGLRGLQKTSLFLAQRGMGNPREIGAGATDYLRQFGLVTLGYMWLQMLKVAFAKRDEGEFYEYKLITGRYFFERVFPETISRAVAIASGAKTMMAMPDAGFAGDHRFSGN